MLRPPSTVLLRIRAFNSACRWTFLMDELLTEEAEILFHLDEATDLMDQAEELLDRADRLLAESGARIQLLRERVKDVH
jgi:hypothetical protein